MKKTYGKKLIAPLYDEQLEALSDLIRRFERTSVDARDTSEEMWDEYHVIYNEASELTSELKTCLLKALNRRVVSTKDPLLLEEGE